MNKKLHLLYKTTKILQSKIINIITSKFISLTHLIFLYSKTLFYSTFLNKTYNIKKNTLKTFKTKTSILPFQSY